MRSTPNAVATTPLPRDDTTRWLAGVDDSLHEKLARVDLVQPRIKATLHGWLEQYLADHEDDMKPESIRKLKQTKTKLLAFFGDGLELRKITVQDAADWRKFLKGLPLSEATIKIHCGNAKTMLAEAVQRKLITDNPFALLKSGSTPSKYSRYINPDEIENYELGYKGYLMDRTISANLAIYYIDWQDLQVATVTDNGSLPITGNGSEAVSQGIEFQGRWLINDNWEAMLTYAFTEAELTADAPGLVGPFDALDGVGSGR